jgi:predicted ATPase
VPSESTILVRPLSLLQWASLDDLAVSEAALVFAERAAGARQGFVVGEHVDSVFEICRSVDGLPLALEVVVALVSPLHAATSSAKTTSKALWRGTVLRTRRGVLAPLLLGRSSCLTMVTEMTVEEM